MSREPRSLREHQQQAIEAATATLGLLPRATVIAACGTGKTLIAIRVAEHFAGQGNVLVLMPTLDLVAQTIRRWREDSSIHRMTAVCSSGRTDYPDITRHVVFTTDPEVLASRLSERPGPAVVFATYASLEVLELAHRRHFLPEWAIVVADEAHHTSGDRGKDWGAVHDDERLPAARRLYMTATPRLWTANSGTRRRKRKPGAPVELASMNDATIYGPVVYRLTLAQAIDRKLLADYRIVVPIIRDEDLREVLHTAEATPEYDGLRLAALQVGLLQAVADYGLRRVVTFHSRIVASQNFADSLPLTAAAISEQDTPPRIWSRAVHSNQTPRQRARCLRQFDTMPLLGSTTRGPLGYQFAILANVKTLGEGVDVPDADGVLFADPKRSAVDIVQSLGRALRQPPGSGKIATLVIPVYLAPGQSTREAMWSSHFSVLWDVLTGLRDHDDRVFHRLTGIRRRRLQDPVLPGPERADEIAPVLDLRTHQIDSGEWADGWNAAVRFVDRHDHFDVPSDYTDSSGFPLGCWVGRHRTHYKAGTLPIERAVALNALGISWPHPPDSFEHHLERAAATASRTGSLAFDPTIPGSDPTLGAWLARMRRRASTSNLESERVDALNAVDPWWNPPWSLRWQHTYTHLRHRLATTTWTIPYHRQADTDTGWNSWLDRQINRRDDLHPGQRHLLHHLARTHPDAHPHTILLSRPATALAAAFTRGLRAARQYHQREGHLDVPAGHCETVDSEQVHLGRWIRQRQRDAAQLTSRQLTALRALGIDPAPHFLQAPADPALTQPAGPIEPPGPPLAAPRIPQPFPHRARSEPADTTAGSSTAPPGTDTAPHHQATAPPAAAVIAQAAPRPTAFEEPWASMLTKAATFAAQHGHLNPAEGALASWLSRQRHLHATGRLATRRRNDLDALGMIWNKHEDAWERGYAHARAFAVRTGHLAVPADEQVEDYNLGTWVRRQRKADLTADQEARLTALDPLWRMAPDWQRSYRRLVAYLAAGGRLTGPVNRTGTPGDERFRPGAWLRMQNRHADTGNLDAHQTALLDALGAWRTHPAQGEPAPYRRAQGSAGCGQPPYARSMAAPPSVPPLRPGPRTDRPAHRPPRSALTPIHQLPAEFRRYIKAARAFRDREGHLDVPPGFVERVEHAKVRLGTWIARQRDKVFRGQLPPLLISELEALDMVWVRR
ncbi:MULTISPECIES: DEAD/DEAH box helicase [Kitasatospora]|uniref:Helicase n=1 Tax=Kitasatospora setae (strain ATCC 33774 / DSM 43861 / JCM 3304 / KCC A-0304 / NBRC 14216 / KM-6054) TaxID=452652 RepID=E4MYW9_KITSK|nr:DEAD/DEAH box helicase [Kitasatospora setae]BAJ25862.1 hypothetical protein KSE_00090t [Kitasatospora setae KM-6054]BAJ33416.1 hypothetical protein KSE_76650t [Kitasatospora setae KM-6054]